MIEVRIFEKPSGNIRGTCVVSLRNKRVAHAFLFSDGKNPQIAIDKTTYVKDPGTLYDYISVLNEFYEALLKAD